MDVKEKDILSNNFKNETINVNGEDYIKAETFMDAIYNVCLSEAIIGCIVSKLGKVELDRKEITDFMGGDYEKVKTEFTADKCLITVIK